MKPGKATPTPKDERAPDSWTHEDEVQWQNAQDVIKGLKNKHDAYQQEIIAKKIRSISANFLEYAAAAIRDEEIHKCAPSSVEISPREHFSEWSTVKITIRAHRDFIEEYSSSK